MHCRYYDLQLVPEFWSLVQCLEEMSNRWIATPLNSTSTQPDSIFYQFASRLRGLYKQRQTDQGFRVTTNGSDLAGDEALWRDGIIVPAAESLVPSRAFCGEEHVSPFNRDRNLAETDMNPIVGPGPSLSQLSVDDDVTTMSQVLMDPRFVDMDRIISFSDMEFTGDINGLFDEAAADWA